jgi:hypothetical protein
VRGVTALLQCAATSSSNLHLACLSSLVNVQFCWTNHSEKSSWRAKSSFGPVAPVVERLGWAGAVVAACCREAVE